MTITATFAIEDVVPVTKPSMSGIWQAAWQEDFRRVFHDCTGIFTAVICPATA